MTAPVDEAFLCDRLEDALDAGTVDATAREHLLAALAELDPERVAERRDADQHGHV
ncbi:MAG: hypothetical protein U5K28_12785 [Halobacteriales archaeon]|nr:hypothetical protein [Halobacteriales archaeon]